MSTSPHLARQGRQYQWRQVVRQPNGREGAKAIQYTVQHSTSVPATDQHTAGQMQRQACKALPDAFSTPEQQGNQRTKTNITQNPIMARILRTYAGTLGGVWLFCSVQGANKKQRCDPAMRHSGTGRLGWFQDKRRRQSHRGNSVEAKMLIISCPR